MNNSVVSGDLAGSPLEVSQNEAIIVDRTGCRYPINKHTIESWQIVDSTSRTSATSAVMRGAIGAFLLGPIGIAAALSAKKKGTHLIAVEFANGKQCLLEVDDKMKEKIIKAMY